jgi:hypothetical protein
MTSHRFPKGHKSMHDLAAAGRKSRKVSPWGKEFSEAGKKTMAREAAKREKEKAK